MMRIALICLLFPFIVNSQKLAEKFTLSPAGFEDSVVREYPGKTDSQLFLAAKMWAEFTISNTQEARTREIKDQYLEYQVFVPQAFTIEDNGSSFTWDAMFDVAFRFENEKIRYDVEIVELSSPDAPAFQIVGGTDDWAFYSDVNSEPYPLTSNARKVMEDIVNDFIRGVSAYVNRDAEVPEKD
ncbi:hypothetical protein MKO06_09600 [Gramella sp. GC03-9]|uniref:DUF4468 domain-containing protein n=1 Tax=Christiangramia oceanisediminis TaxID=2920386 RepID=A0A9X2KXM1_9FLAO|nr:hypothetical protein [Gramella oceanisediminis]MCP9200163.1 hypothetical protein [Gramella oceanisediminis]